MGCAAQLFPPSRSCSDQLADSAGRDEHELMRVPEGSADRCTGCLLGTTSHSWFASITARWLAAHFARLPFGPCLRRQSLATSPRCSVRTISAAPWQPHHPDQMPGLRDMSAPSGADKVEARCLTPISSFPVDSPIFIDYRRWSMDLGTQNRTHPEIDRDQAVEWATWFHALADPTRILILHLLSGEDRAMTVGEITAQLDVGQSTVSHHLAKLAEVRFLLVERSGTQSYWRVNEACISAFPSAAEIILGRIPSTFTAVMERS